MNTTIARYVLGVVSLAVILGSLGLAAVTLRRLYFPDWTGALARLAEAVIALATLITTLQLLGAVGLFRLLPIVIAALLIGAAVGWAAGIRRTVPRPAASRHGWVDNVRAPAPTTTALSLLAAATVTAVWASPMLQSYDVGIHTFDSVYYHLPWAATFARTGRITPLQYDIQYMLQFYPASAELLHALGILALTRDTISPAVNFLWFGLTLLAAWCIGRPRGLGPTTMLGATLALATPMIVFSQAGSADNDVAGVALLMASVALIVSGEQRSAATVLAAIAAGMALAVKLTLFGPVLALTVGVIAIAARGRRVRTAGLWLLPLILAGAFWYIRNLFSVGNPLPWVSFGLLPTPAPALQQHTGYSVAHYLFNGRFWSHFFVSGIASELGAWWWAIIGAAIVGPLLCLGPGSDRLRRMLGLVALASIVAYLLTPEGAQGPAGDPVGVGFNMRYLAPGLTLSLAILPLAPVLAAPWRQVVVAVAFVATLAATVAKPSLWPRAHSLAAVVIGGLALALLVLLVLRPRRAQRAVRPDAPAGSRRLGPVARVLVAAGVLLLLSAGAAAGYSWQRHYLRGRYQFRKGVSYMARVWAMFSTVHDARIGVGGTYGGFFSYPLFGASLSNTVLYIAHHGPHGSFTPITSCRAWRTEVNAGHFQYLVTTPGREFWEPKVLLPSPEGRWTASDPNARLIYSRRALDQRISVFELRGPLHPGACR